MQFVLFNYQVLPFQARVDLLAMAMKGYSVFPKASASMEPHQQIVQCHIHDSHGGVSYLSAETQSVYFIAPADWAQVSLEGLVP